MPTIVDTKFGEGCSWGNITFSFDVCPQLTTDSLACIGPGCDAARMFASGDTAENIILAGFKFCAYGMRGTVASAALLYALNWKLAEARSCNCAYGLASGNDFGIAILTLEQFQYLTSLSLGAIYVPENADKYMRHISCEATANCMMAEFPPKHGFLEKITGH